MYKDLLYNWFGYNKTIFCYLNNITDNYIVLNILKFFTDYIGNFMMLPVHFIIIIALAYHMSQKHKKDLHTEILYLKSILTLLVAYMLFISLGTLAKENLSYARPYCSPDINLNELISSMMHYSKSKCFKSLPSGHSAYITTLVLSMWPTLNNFFKVSGIFTILLIITSRVILGAHFPADVVYGVLLGITVVLISRFLIKGIVIKPTLEKLKKALNI